MLVNYINPKTKRIYTPAMFPTCTCEADFLKKGLKPVRYDYPAYDDTFYTITPKPELVEKNGTYHQEFDIVARDLDQIKQALKEKLAAKRWQVETGGIEVDGNKVNTDLDSQNRVNVLLNGMEITNTDYTMFKFPDGWMELSLEQVRNIAAAITAHVEACFAKEKVLSDLIDATETVTDLIALDLNSDWPANTNVVE